MSGAGTQARAKRSRARLSSLRPEIRRWSTRSTLAIIDQGLVSGTSLLVSIFLARTLPPDTYGAFAIAFTCFLFVSGFHNVLLLEPMSVLGPASHRQHLPSYFAGQIQIHAILVAVLSGGLLCCAAVMAVHSRGQETAKALVALGLVLPFLLLSWLSRRMLYTLQRPTMACTGSLSYLGCCSLGLAGVRHFHSLTAVTALAVLGISSLVSSVFLLRMAGVRFLAIKNRVDIRGIFRENWNYGKWMVGASILYSTACYGQMFLTASISGVAAAGVLRAMQLPSLVMTQATTAISQLALSNLAYDFGQGRLEKLRAKGQIITFALTSTAIAYGLILVVMARWIEHLFYGGRFASEAHLIPFFGIVPVLTAFGTGLSVVLRALQITKVELFSNSIAAPVAIGSAFVAIELWGLWGAAISCVAAAAVSAAVTGYFYFSPAMHRCSADSPEALVQAPS